MKKNISILIVLTVIYGAPFWFPTVNSNPVDIQRSPNLLMHDVPEEYGFGDRLTDEAAQLGQEFEEPITFSGTVPREVQELDLQHNNENDEGPFGFEEDVLYHNPDEDNGSLLVDSGNMIDPLKNTESVGFGFPVTTSEEPFTPFLEQQNIPSNLSINDILTFQKSNNAYIRNIVNKVENNITQLSQKKSVIFADYVDPLGKLENAKSMIEAKIDSWDDIWSDVDAMMPEQIDVAGQVFDEMLDQLSRVEGLLLKTQSIMQSKSIQDIINLYQEANAVDTDVQNARIGNFWGKNGSLRNAAERIERLRFILEGASKFSPDGLPASDPQSYLHTIEGINNILQRAELNLQQKQMMELKRNNLINRTKDTYADLSKLTGVADYTSNFGRQTIKNAKQITKELDAIITTDLDYRDHILQEHNNKAFEMLTNELINRRIIGKASELTPELLQRPDVLAISTHLFEGQGMSKEWQDSVDYVLIHSLKVEMEWRIQSITEGMKAFKANYGSGAIKKIRKNYSSSSTFETLPTSIDFSHPQPIAETDL